ncbi:MAG: Glu-tRNA(Gln) amidotransferase subunit GatE, partial [Myxococcota bacterium]|nr:Glu-tRNA(Gln) amidotransferase subunit GatE [Myxococcota bacterium]
MKTPSEMSAEDYARLGFMSGLEVHTQLATQKKLFCRCPVRRYSPRYDAEILRHMRPTLSELGEYDGTALMEFKTRKNIVYRLNRDTVCTYEMDDAPPFELNTEALDIALEIALLLDLNLVDELHVARKQYLDGSIPTGFQRTMILGVDGWIACRGRRIGIRQLGLEEDACREVSDVGHCRTYMTDRLSLPLIEVVTEPELRTPREVVEAAQVIRRLTRSTGKVHRGPGAARQDVNVSIAGGSRCEIKGVDRIGAIEKLVHYEALRQKALLEIRDEMARRGLDAAGFAPAVRDVTGPLKHTVYPPIRSAMAQGAQVLAVRLPGMEGILAWKTGPGVRFAREFEGRVRVVACLDAAPNLAWSDVVESLSARQWERVRRFIGGEDRDAVVLVWGPADDARTAAGEVALRAREAPAGVPCETRQAMPDGTTGFERILPGPDRMYPDTDLPPITLDEERIARARERVGMPPWTREEALRRMGLHDEMIGPLMLDGRGALFDRVARVPGTDPAAACVVLTQVLKALRREGVPVGRIDEPLLERLFRIHGRGRFHRERFPAVLRALAANPDRDVEAVVSEVVGEPLDDATLDAEIDRLLADGAWRREDPGKSLRLAMGVAMRGVRGRAAAPARRR